MLDLSFLYDTIAKIVPLECLQPRFMQQALLGLLLLAPMCAAMGVQVINFRMAFFSDAISHSALSGIALGLLLNFDVRISMLTFGVLVGLSIMKLGHSSALSSDTIIGVFFATAIAFGLAVVSSDINAARNLQSYLYGDILTIGDEEIWWMIALFIILSVFQIFCFNRLIYIGLNPSLAMAHNVPVHRYQYFFSILLSLVVIFSVWAVGVLLVTAMLIIPAACGRNLAKSSRSMFWLAQIVSIIGCISGLIISGQPWANMATGATIILSLSALFGITLIYNIIAKKIQNHS